MTKKDYELIANTIKISVDDNLYLRDVKNVDREKQTETLAQIVLDLSESLKRDNEKFNPDKFKITCGFRSN